MKHRLFTLVCALALVVAGAARADRQGEPTGLDQVRFGMSPDAVKQQYPSLQLIAPEPEPQEGKPHIRMAMYRLADQKLGKLTCNVDLKFLVGKLSFLDFYCNDKQDIPSYLESTYGAPLRRDSGGWQWDTSGVLVSYAPASGVFNVVQKRANDALQGSMFLYLMQQQGGQGQQGGGDGK